MVVSRCWKKLQAGKPGASFRWKRSGLRGQETNLCFQSEAGRVHSVSFECFPSDALGCYSRRMHWQSHPGRQINTAQHNECKNIKIIEDEHCSLSPHLTCCLQVWKHWKLLGPSWRSAAATSRHLALVGGSNSNWKQCANTWNWLCS